MLTFAKLSGPGQVHVFALKNTLHFMAATALATLGFSAAVRLAEPSVMWY